MQLNIWGCIDIIFRSVTLEFQSYRFGTENVFDSFNNLWWSHFTYVVKKEYKYVRGGSSLQRSLRIADWWCRNKNQSCTSNLVTWMELLVKVF